MSASKDRKIVEMHAEINRLRTTLDAALDVVIDLGGEVREPEMDEARRLRADAERLDWMSEHEAHIGWNREGDACRVWVRSDNDFGAWAPVCGWSAFFQNHRAAIDAARKEGT